MNPGTIWQRNLDVLHVLGFGHEISESWKKTLRKCRPGLFAKIIPLFIYLHSRSLPASITHSNNKFIVRSEQMWIVATAHCYLNCPNGLRKIIEAYLTDFSSQMDYDSLGKCPLWFLEHFQATAMIKRPRGMKTNFQMVHNKYSVAGQKFRLGIQSLN